MSYSTEIQNYDSSRMIAYPIQYHPHTRQREFQTDSQVQDIEDDIDKLESNVERAEQLVINFTRRMASDKIIQFFMVFNIVIVIIIVIYASVTGKSLTSKSKHGSSSDFFGTHAPTVQPTSFAPTTS
jgi:hypothetical protein